MHEQAYRYRPRGRANSTVGRHHRRHLRTIRLQVWIRRRQPRRMSSSRGAICICSYREIERIAQPIIRGRNEERRVLCPRECREVSERLKVTRTRAKQLRGQRTYGRLGFNSHSVPSLPLPSLSSTRFGFPVKLSRRDESVPAPPAGSATTG